MCHENYNVSCKPLFVCASDHFSFSLPNVCFFFFYIAFNSTGEKEKRAAPAVVVVVESGANDCGLL